MTKIIWLILVTMTALTGCQSTVSNHPRFEFNPSKMRHDLFTGAYAQVDFRNGVDKHEAEVLGRAYFLSYISGCGVTLEPIEKGSSWEVPVVFGIVAVPIEPIVIDRTTGTMTHPRGPVVIPPNIITEIKTDPTATYSGVSSS